MAVEHHRAFSPVSRRCPNIQKEAVFRWQSFADSKVGSQRRLQRRRPTSERVANTCPGLQRRRGLESICPGHRSRVGNAFERCEPVRCEPTNAAIRGLDFDILLTPQLCQRVLMRRNSSPRQRCCAAGDKFTAIDAEDVASRRPIHIHPFRALLRRVPVQLSVSIASTETSSRRAYDNDAECGLLSGLLRTAATPTDVTAARATCFRTPAFR